MKLNLSLQGFRLDADAYVSFILIFSNEQFTNECSIKSTTLTIMDRKVVKIATLHEHKCCRSILLILIPMDDLPLNSAATGPAC